MLTPEQERICRDLKELVSTGIADIYRGACEIRNNKSKPPLAAMTVAHYLREVESALRAVLTPYAPPGTKHKNKGGSGGHDASINTVLAVIGVEPDDPNVAVWRRFSDRGDPQHLTAYAHRNGLDATRAFDDAFDLACASFDALLMFVLGRMRASATRLTQNLKELLAIARPNANDVKVLRNNVPAAPFMFDHIFDAPLNPLWIDELVSAGFFAEPPPGSATIAAVFAMNLAPTDPERSRSILQQLPAIDDAHMAHAYLETMQLLGDADPLLVAKILNWVQSPAFATSGLPRFPRFNKLIAYLGTSGDTTSALALLDALTVVNPPKEERNPFFRDPEALLDPDEYDEVVLAGIDALATRAAADLIRLLSDRLEFTLAVSFRDRTPSPSGKEDISEAWLATFTDPDVRLYSLKHVLTQRLADALIAAVESDPASISAHAAQLRGRSYRVFRRLEAQLLLHADANSIDAADAMVTDPRNYWSIAPQAEFGELLRIRFPHLDDAQKQTVLAAITADLDRAVINEDASDDDFREIKERRVHNYLMLLSGHLPEAYSERLVEVATRLGPSTDLALPVTEVPQTIAQQSTLTTEEFLSLTLPELNDALSARSYAYGTATQLRKKVEDAPDQFERGLAEFESLYPAYLRAIVSGFAHALRTSRAFNWSLVLTFCQRVLQRPDAHRIVPGDLGNEWSALRTEIANLITDGASGQFRTFDESMRETVIAIIDSIVIDEPSPRNEPSELDGQLTRSFIEPHAAALRALIWVINRFRETDDRRPLVDRDGIRSQPDAAGLLDRILMLPDTTVHVHAGGRFDFFCRIDLPWARSAIPLIFPTTEVLDQAQRAAWETFIAVCPAMFYSYDELKEQYRLSARVWPIEDAKTGTPDNYPNGLARHFLALYQHGRLSLGDLAHLYSRLSDKAAKHAMFRLADHAASLGSGFGEGEIARFLSFWDWRIKQIARVPAEHIEELKSFGAWVCTLVLPEQSALGALKTVLAITGGAIEPSHRIIKCLVEVSDGGLASALERILLLVDGHAGTTNLYFWRDDIRDILLRARDSDEATIALARSIAGHLTVKRLKGFEHF